MITLKTNDDELKAALNDLLKKVSDPRPALSEIGEIMVASITRNFEKSGRPEPWEQLSSKTLQGEAYKGGGYKKNGELKKAAQRRVEGKKILMDSGQLRASITHEVKGNSVLVGTNKEYGAAHQFGAKIPPHTIKPRHAKALFWGGAAHPVKKVSLPEINIPARPFIVVQDEDKQEILSAINRYLL